MTIGDSANIELRWGTVAKTDGKTIELPYFDPSNELLKTIGLGFLIHEGGHVRFTDFDCIPVNSQPLDDEIFNRLEDRRIELKMMEIYGGAASILAETARHVFSNLPDNGEIDKTKPATLLLDYILFRQRCSLPGQEFLETCADEYLDVMRQTFPAHSIDQLQMLLAKAETVASTADTWALAEQIRQLFDLDNNSDDQDQHPDQQDSNQAEGNSSQQGTSEDDAKTKNLREVLKDQNPSGVDTSQLIADELNAGYREAQQTGDGMLPGISGVSEVKIRPRFGEAEVARLIANRLSTKLAAALEEDLRIKPRPARRGKRILGNKICNAITGDVRIYRAEARKRIPNAAIQLLLDRSESMNGIVSGNVTRIQLARRAALGLACTLDMFSHIGFAAAAFPAEEDKIIDLQKFDQTARSCAGLYGGLSATGGTPLANALMRAAQRLSTRKEDRKIIIVISDGEPNEKDAVRKVVKRCERSGFEMYGLSIENNALSNFIDRTAVLTDGAYLPEALFDLAGKIVRT
jgi:uncharacterized protein YegL